MIYFFLGEVTRNIKIGFTSNLLEDRARSLRCSSPDSLAFLGGKIGDLEEERTIHRKFAKYQLHGEWFRENDELYNFIDTNCIKCSKCLEIVIDEVEKGSINWRDALWLSGDQILELQNNRINKVLKKLLLTLDEGIPIPVNKIVREDKDRPSKRMPEKIAHQNRV